MRRENESIILLIPHRGGNYRRENNQGRQNIQTAETSGLSNKAKHNIDLIQDGAGGYYRERKSGGDYPVPRWRWRLRWLVIAVGLVRAYLAKGSYHSLYYSIEKPLKFFQTGALLEILHCAVGIVPSSVVLTSFQVMSRVFLIWAVTHSVKEVQSEDSVLLFVIAWTITEIIRYSFYTFSLLNHLPYLIKWARYTLFIVLYPMGVSGELLTIYAALPFVRQSGLYSISLPNKYNFSFDYYAFLILIMISYIPIFPQLYFHMIHQRRKVLSHTEEHKKFE
ncbi:very-long-chain (3R)-3-hydroxyacyl-CoA dehydratase 2 isoform X3 [Neophocaena asiaeorientalis asiaeorientalis]|uniref:Very-long-chain (3R)-3-hydroxyacyl-CoA dehydratase n=1 Tax=Neophocaena asiaeorientalis asiaeorientalis TaxID=1706337 RepID=A0A341CEE7_NEOAA|nr:very-long-chain (3R)-3-hydroxyacyl-CoA dehydratase 2 isoform X3 [Neophocaena asiaeorientalis asiaeorientalis]